MKIETKFNVGDDVWLYVRKKPFKTRVKGLKVVVKEITILSPDGTSETKISLKNRYLIGNKWIDEFFLARNEKELELNSMPL